MSKHDDYPDFVARFYDVIYANLRDAVDKTYYLKKIKQCKGPVLEIGVGTGRIFIPALADGADIYGIDVSANMIAKLKKQIASCHRKRVKVQNAIKLKLSKKFDLIIAPFRVMSHVIQTEEQIRVLNNVYQHLNRNGIFIFDLYVPNLKLLIEGMDRRVDFEGEYEPGKKLIRRSSVTSDLINQISYVTMESQWDENGKQKSKEWQFLMRFYFRYELEHLIARSKLTLVNIYGNFDENPLSSTSKEFIVVGSRL